MTNTVAPSKFGLQSQLTSQLDSLLLLLHIWVLRAASRKCSLSQTFRTSGMAGAIYIAPGGDMYLHSPDWFALSTREGTLFYSPSHQLGL